MEGESQVATQCPLGPCHNKATDPSSLIVKFIHAAHWLIREDLALLSKEEGAAYSEGLAQRHGGKEGPQHKVGQKLYPNFKYLR